MELFKYIFKYQRRFNVTFKKIGLKDQRRFNNGFLKSFIVVPMSI